MKVSTYTAAALLSAGATAFPTMPDQVFKDLQEGSAEWVKREARDSELASQFEAWDEFEGLAKRGLGQQQSKAEKNCGPRLPCPIFNEKDQYVSVTGEHVYQDPTANQIRGPCPGLNAASNYNYLPRDGVATFTETVTGLGALYNMSPDLAGFLAAYAIVFDGDLISQTWSIGGPPPYIDPTGLLTPPQGISYSHNKYEGDTSIGRNDAYLNNGDAYSLDPVQFKNAFSTGQDDGTDRYTFDKFRQATGKNQQNSIATNPYYFAPLFSTTLVAPAAYNFVINFMSNHSKENPNGYLTGDQFKLWFSMKGKYNKNAKDGGLTWIAGKEKIPKNWYRRPTYNQYNAIDVFLDLARGWAAYPDTFRFGGNTNGVNTYQGIDVATLTGGTFTNGDVLKPKNFGCLIFESQQQAVPDELKGGINKIAPALKLIAANSGFLAKLDCPKLAKYDSSVFNAYPGHTYSPKAPCQNHGGRSC